MEKTFKEWATECFNNEGNTENSERYRLDFKDTVKSYIDSLRKVLSNRLELLLDLSNDYSYGYQIEEDLEDDEIKNIYDKLCNSYGKKSLQKEGRKLLTNLLEVLKM